MTRSQAQQEADQAALIVNSRPASGRLMCDNVLHVCERGSAGRWRSGSRTQQVLLEVKPEGLHVCSRSRQCSVMSSRADSRHVSSVSAASHVAAPNDHNPLQTKLE